MLWEKTRMKDDCAGRTVTAVVSMAIHPAGSCCLRQSAVHQAGCHPGCPEATRCSRLYWDNKNHSISALYSPRRPFVGAANSVRRPCRFSRSSRKPPPQRSTAPQEKKLKKRSCQIFPTRSKLGLNVGSPGFHPAGQTSMPPFSRTKEAACSFRRSSCMLRPMLFACTS